MEYLNMIMVIFMVLMTMAADYFLKIAGQQKTFVTASFLIGMVLYTLTAFIWYFILKNLKFSLANILYSVFTIIFSVGIGVLYFKEHLNVLEYIAMGMAIISIIILARFH